MGIQQKVIKGLIFGVIVAILILVGTILIRDGGMGEPIDDYNIDTLICGVSTNG